jgi:hypothetical protein
MCEAGGEEGKGKRGVRLEVEGACVKQGRRWER